MRDDCAGLLDLIREADRLKVIDPIPWLKGAVKARAPAPLLDGAHPDPWGVRAWIAKHRITTTATGQRGQIGPAVNGYMVEDVAEEVAHAADLDPSWRGNWDAIGAWMRDDIGLTGAALAAIRNQAGRMREQGTDIRSIAVFDTAVRTVARSAA